MKIVNIHEAKTHLSRLIEQVINGKPLIIAKAGKPLVKLVSLSAPEAGQLKRLGFMSDQHIRIPDDFDQMGSSEIEQLFSPES